MANPNEIPAPKEPQKADCNPRLVVPPDFQTAPYDDLCGCVAALIPDWAVDQFQPDRANIEGTKRLLEMPETQRIVEANCPKCGGTGIRHNASVMARPDGGPNT